MPRGRAPGYDTQREQILARAAELFARQGYPGTSMNQVAVACGVSKPSLYHYVHDKYQLLVEITQGHVDRLRALVADDAELAGAPAEPARAPVEQTGAPVEQAGAPAEPAAASAPLAGTPAEVRLRQLITRFMIAYANSQASHRVLTEDVKFLETADRKRVLDGEREVVEAFARAIAAVRPDLGAARLQKPLTMLLFGMMNWMFTWLRPGGPLSHADMTPIVSDLFLGGLAAVSATVVAEGSRPAAARAGASRLRPARAATRSTV